MNDDCANKRLVFCLRSMLVVYFVLSREALKRKMCDATEEVVDAAGVKKYRCSADIGRCVYENLIKNHVEVARRFGLMEAVAEGSSTNCV